MFKRFLLSTILVLTPTLAFAQTAAQVVPGYNAPVGRSGCPSVGPCFIPGAPSQPLGYQQLTSLAAATALTVPTGALEALIVCESQTVRWRDDGTNPTASVGMPLTANVAFPYLGNLAAIKIIQTTASATCNVSYY
jgi:hypothetical protein